MAGNKIGGIKAAATNKERYGDDWYARIGAKGGSRSTPTGGFGADRERARIAGAKGGSISRRGEAKEWYDNHKYEIAAMKDEGISYKEMAQRLGVTLSKMYYTINTYGE